MVRNKFLGFSGTCFILLLLMFAGLGCQQSQVQPTDSEIIKPEFQQPVQDMMTGIEDRRMQAVSFYVDAMMLNDINQREQAVQKLNQAVMLDPEFALAFSFKGDILQQLEEYEDSADAYERAAELDPWSFKDFFNLGKVCQIIEQFARAVRAYVTACNLKPEHYEAHLGAAQCYFQLKELDDAMTYAQKAKQMAPDQADPERLLGDIFEEQKDHTQAINAYRRALELEGNQPEIMVPLARAYLRSGRYGAAKELLTDVIDMQPDNGIAHQYLGFAELKLKNTQVAVEYYEQAVKIDGSDWMAHKGLGVAYMLMSMRQRDENMQARAIEQWKISLQIKPDQPRLKQLLERYTN